MIRLNITEEQLNDQNELIGIVQKIFWYQVFYKDAIGKDIKLIGVQKALYNNDFVNPLVRKLKIDFEHNFVKPLCDTATSTFLGRVPDIVSNGSEKEKERIAKFVLLQKHNEFEEEIYDTALQDSICGSGFICLYNDNGDNFPHYRSLDPKYTNVVYDCSIAMKRLCAYHIYFEQTANGGRYVCILYTKKYMYAFATGQISIPSKMAFNVYPLNMFLLNGAKLDCKVEHGYKDIPIIEFINNKLCVSDCKPALPIMAMYSALQNNRFQNVDDILNYLLFIKNARMGNDDEADKAMTLIKRHRVIALEGDNVDAKFLSNPLNQADIQNLADDFKKEIHYITHIPDFTSVDFTQNASDPILKAKTKPLLDLCLDKEKWFNKGYMILLDLTLDFVKRNDSKLYESIKFDLDNIDLVYTHTLPSNDTDMVNNIVNLGNQGLLNPEVALQGLSFIPNVDAYLKGAKEWNKYIDDRKSSVDKEKSMQNNNNGLNETNLVRQNAKPQNNDNMDNKANFIKGVSQDLSDNKV